MILRVLMCILLWPVAAFADSYPRVLEHALVQMTISAEPRRIVSAGYHEQDFLYALGLAPVGVHEWFGNRPYADGADVGPRVGAGHAHHGGASSGPVGGPALWPRHAVRL